MQNVLHMEDEDRLQLSQRNYTRNTNGTKFEPMNMIMLYDDLKYVLLDKAYNVMLF